MHRDTTTGPSPPAYPMQTSPSCPPATYPYPHQPRHPYQQQQPVQQPGRSSNTGKTLKEVIIMVIGVPLYFILYTVTVILLSVGAIFALAMLWSVIGIYVLFLAIPVILVVIVFSIKDSTVLVSKDVVEMMRQSGQLGEDGFARPATRHHPYQRQGNPHPPRGNYPNPPTGSEPDSPTNYPKNHPTGPKIQR